MSDNQYYFYSFLIGMLSYCLLSIAYVKVKKWLKL